MLSRNNKSLIKTKTRNVILVQTLNQVSHNTTLSIIKVKNTSACELENL